MFKVLQKKEEISELIKDHEIFIFDCDGVLWGGGKILGNSDKCLEFLLKERGPDCIFFFSNSTHRTRKEFHEVIHKRFHPLVFSADLEHYLSPSFGCSTFIHEYFENKDENEKPTKKEHVCLISNNQGFPDELREMNIPFYRMNEETIYVGHDEYAKNIFPTVKDAKVLILGYDRMFTYYKLTHAITILRENKECLFIISDDDVTFPWALPNSTEQIFLPGTGSYAKAVTHACGRKDGILIGKPSNYLLERLIKIKGFEGKRDKILFFGDSMVTDIKCCDSSKINSVLVLTGMNKLEDIKNFDYSPTFVMDSLGCVCLAQK